MPDFVKRVSAYYAGARKRAGRRKSVWNAVLIPFSMAAWVVVWYLLFRLVWLFHIAFYPDHHLEDFWQEGSGFRSAFLSFLMVFSLMFGAGALGFMLTNVIFRLIPPARKAFDSEARGHTGTGFRPAMRTLCKFCIWTLFPGLLIALVAAYFLKSLR